jgi:hypothetical protein
MQTQAFPPIVVAFLVLDQPRQRLSHWMQALAPLDDQRAPPLASVNGYYDPTCDQGLLGVSYDELALGGERLAYVVNVALLAEIGMIQPAELAEGDRRRFLSERLTRCTVTVTHQRSVLGALTELVRRIREQRASRSSSHTLPRPPKPPPVPPIAMLARRSSAPDPDLLIVQPRSTRDDLGELKRRQMQEIAKGRRPSRNVIARAPSPQPPPAPAPPPAPEAGRAATTQMDPLDSQRLAAAHLPPGASRLSDTTRPNAASPPAEAPPPEIASAEPYAPAATPLPPGSIYARYLRSGRWVPIRIGALSLRGAALMTGALPRVRDKVEIALAYANHRALVGGSVHKVSTGEEAARRGAASFSVLFELEDRSRGQLTALLHAARAANVTIKPPPPRDSRRYPVEWPVCLGTARGAVRAEALDVSREGMFVRQSNSLSLDAHLNFSVVLDDRGGPVSGRSRVVRFMDETGARSRGLAPGYGLRIVDMADADRERWAGFLARVERRAERRVLIGASTGRLCELQGGLAAAGYVVACASDPEALMRFASRDEYPADACLIDAGWQPPGSTGTWSEALFPTRNVPCVAMRGDVRRAREAIDQVLSIV